MYYADGTREYWEVKGWMDKVSRTRLNRMRRHFPEVRIVVIDPRAYEQMKAKWGRMIPRWE